MRTTLLKHALPFLFSALTLACHEEDGVDKVASTLPPSTLENALFYASDSPDGGAAFTLDVATKDAKIVHHDLPAGPIQTFARPGSNGREVVVFTGGVVAHQLDGKQVPAVKAYVILFNREREVLRQVLSSQYSQLTLTDDGKYAIAFGSSGNFALQNAVEVISFDKALAKASDPNAPEAATKIDLSLDGRQPTSFIFEPTTSTTRRLAIAPLANALQVIDLVHPEQGEFSITLSNTSTLQPQKVVFAGEQFFVQSQSSNQILSFQILPSTTGPHPFQLAPTILTATAPVADLTTAGSGDSLRLLALTGQLEVIDPLLNSSTKIPGVTQFSQIYKFDGTSPLDSTVAPRAALYSTRSTQIGFVDLGSESAWATRNVDLIELGDPLVSLTPVPGKNLVLASHSTNRVSVIDLQKRTVKRVLLDSAASTTLLDPSGTNLHLWVGTSGGALGVIDLQTFTSNEVPLTFKYANTGSFDESRQAPFTTSEALLLVPGAAGTPNRRIAVLQTGTSGRVTLLDADNPTSESALEVLGFYLEGLFD